MYRAALLGECAEKVSDTFIWHVPNHHEMIGYQADMGQHYWGLPV